MAIFLNILFLLLGFALLVKGADWFVLGASGIAKKARISEMVIGLTIVAFGTSAPEAAVSITAAIGGAGGISVGTVLGSNTLNILLILGLVGVIRAIPVKKSTLWIEMPFMFLLAVVFLLLGFLGNDIDRVDGAILLVMFAAFMTYTVLMAKRSRKEVLLETTAAKAVEAQSQPITSAAASPFSTPQGVRARVRAWTERGMNKLWFVLIVTAVGLGMVVAGSVFAVNTAKTLASMAGVSDTVIALTIVALGTSLPELVTSVTAARRGNNDIAIGNIVGSFVFNLLFIGGLSALINPLVFETSLLFDGIMCIVSAVILFLCVVWKRHELGRVGGILMLITFVAYWTVIILRGLNILVF